MGAAAFAAYLPRSYLQSTLDQMLETTSAAHAAAEALRLRCHVRLRRQILRRPVHDHRRHRLASAALH